MYVKRIENRKTVKISIIITKRAIRFYPYDRQDTLFSASMFNILIISISCARLLASILPALAAVHKIP